MAFVICEPCVDVKDTACVQVCPVDCIYEFQGENQLYIHPTECIDCGACEPECPVEAIFPEATVPSQWRNYIDLNKSIFDKHPTDQAIGRGATAAAKAEAPAATPQATPTSVDSSAGELEALRRLLTEVSQKRTTSADALEKVLPLLEKLGVRVTEK